MQWEIRHHRDGFAVAAQIERGFEPPDWYVDEPLVDERDRFYLTAFRELGTTRQFGMGMGPIPWNEVIRYAEIKRLDHESTEMLVDVISELDAAYLKWHSDETRKPK